MNYLIDKNDEKKGLFGNSQGDQIYLKVLAILVFHLLVELVEFICSNSKWNLI